MKVSMLTTRVGAFLWFWPAALAGLEGMSSAGSSAPQDLGVAPAPSAPEGLSVGFGNAGAYVSR